LRHACNNSRRRHASTPHASPAARAAREAEGGPLYMKDIARHLGD
jgi:hypothetical protein